jgi:DNA-directed RNA polymerase specialized sigma24 family protein
LASLLDKQQFDSLQSQLDKMTKLIALKDEERESEKVRLLDTIGFRPSEIARILNKSLSNVTTVLTGIRKKMVTPSDEKRQEPAVSDVKRETVG